MLFFELLQVALGNKDKLSYVPTFKEWDEMYDESEKQAVTGILLHGIERLSSEQRPPQDILLEWIGESQMIEQQNHLVDSRCDIMLLKLKAYGLQGSILKGQGIAKLYDEKLQSLRQSGDIDVYVNCGFKKALAFAKSLGQNDIEWDYKHLHLKLWDDVEVEMHYRIEVLLNLWKNRKLQKWFNKHLYAVSGSRFRVQDGEIVTPTIEFNLFYILLHIYRHFLYEGVGMRQLMDYYFVLKSHTDNADNIDILNVLQEFGMIRFARGVMWIMQDIFGLERKYMYCEPLESEGRFILGEVMTGGNFGHHDQRLRYGGGKMNTVKQVCRHNWHLMNHYPADVVWAPVWFVWHKCWKLVHRI